MATRIISQPIVHHKARSAQPPYFLSGLLAAVTLIGSAAGFFITDLFQRDNAALGGCARGTALVILAAALPVLVVSMFLTVRGVKAARLVWLGMLLYILYNSVYYTFSATFNRFTPVFIAMLSLAGWSLLVVLRETDAEAIRAGFGPKTPTRFTAIFLLLPVLIFLITDLREVLSSALTDALPASILDTQMPTNHFHVMDLAFLVPLFLMAVVWLWQKRAWGYTLAGMMLSYYAVELLGIGADQWYGGNADPTSPLADASLMMPFIIGALVFLAVLVAYLWHARGGKQA